jgi:serine/threonine protein kinase
MASKEDSVTSLHPSSSVATGTRLGKYEIVHRIACGGMAEIYLARAGGIHGFQKYVVLKRILPQYATNAEFVRMFLKEARVAALLDHANIAHVYDIGEEDGSYFFTMEYLHGEDLHFIMRELARKGRRLPLERALTMVIGAAAGLHFAHEKKGDDGRPLGLVHRDVSPSNIFVTFDGGVKVVDFGIAKVTAEAELSLSNKLKGKLAYMSPEQMSSGSLDRRSDVFALGIVLYETTTHARLFRAEGEAATMRSVMEGLITPPIERIDDYPPRLQEIVLRALERDPSRRYPTARALQIDVEGFARDQRLDVSSAALAEWMERSFGPKQELWRTLPRGRSSGDHSRPTRSQVLAEVTRRLPPPDAIEGLGGVRTGPPMTGGRRRRGLALAAAATVLVAAGGIWFSTRRTPVAQPAPPSASVVIVAEQGTVSIEHAASPPAATAPATPPARAEPRPSAPERASTSSPTAPRRSGAPSAASAGESFSASFSRRSREIRRCFSEHSDQAASAFELSLRFEVGRDGHVTSARVQPPSVGSTLLGKCLVEVATGTTFSRQPNPVVFHIPLTVQLDGRKR